MCLCGSLVLKLSPTPLLAAYVTFETLSEKCFSDGGSKVMYVAKSKAVDGLGMRLTL